MSENYGQRLKPPRSLHNTHNIHGEGVLSERSSKHNWQHRITHNAKSNCRLFSKNNGTLAT